MKKSLANILEMRNKSENDSIQNLIEFLSGDELATLRGGDKEYTPLYEDEDSFEWKKPSSLFDLL